MKIKIEKTDNIIDVCNLSEESVKIEFFTVRLNFAHYVCLMDKDQNVFIDLNVNTWKYCKKDDTIIIIASDKQSVILYKTQRDGDLVVEISNTKNIDIENILNSPVVIITGHSGGGTSIVTKLLISRGLIVGLDTGSFNMRRPHESILFRAICNRIESNYTINEIYTNYNEIADTVKNDIIRNFEFFWPDWYPNNNLIWGFKQTDMYNSSIVLSRLFNNATFLTIIKNNDKENRERSPQGIRFENASIEQVMKYQRPIIEGARVFNIDYERFFTDYNYTNRILLYIKLRLFYSNNDYINCLKEIKFDSIIHLETLEHVH